MAICGSAPAAGVSPADCGAGGVSDFPAPAVSAFAASAAGTIQSGLGFADVAVEAAAPALAGILLSMSAITLLILSSSAVRFCSLYSCDINFIVFKTCSS